MNIKKTVNSTAQKKPVKNSKLKKDKKIPKIKILKKK